MKVRTAKGEVDLSIPENIRKGMAFSAPQWFGSVHVCETPEGDGVWRDPRGYVTDVCAGAERFLGCLPSLASRADCELFGIVGDALAHGFAKLRDGSAVDFRRVAMPPGAIVLGSQGQRSRATRQLTGPLVEGAGRFLGLHTLYANSSDVAALCCGAAHPDHPYVTCSLAIGEHSHHERISTGVTWPSEPNRSNAPTGVRFEYRQGPSPGIGNGVTSIGGPGLEMNGTIVLRGSANGGVRMAGASSKAPPWPTVLAEGAGAVCAMLGTLSLIFRVWDERVAKEVAEVEEREADAAQLRALMALPPSDLSPDGWRAAVLALAEPPYGDATRMMPSIIPALRRLARGDGAIQAILNNHAVEHGSALAASIALHAYARATATVRPVGPGRSGTTWKTRVPKLTVDDGRDE